MNIMNRPLIVILTLPILVYIPKQARACVQQIPCSNSTATTTLEFVKSSLNLQRKSLSPTLHNAYCPLRVLILSLVRAIASSSAEDTMHACVANAITSFVLQRHYSFDHCSVSLLPLVTRSCLHSCLCTSHLSPLRFSLSIFRPLLSLDTGFIRRSLPRPLIPLLLFL